MAPTVSAQEALHARVSFDAGSTMVQGREDADWANAPTNTLVFGGDTLWVDQRGTAEVEFAGGSYLRMADGSKAEITALPPSATVRVWVGSVYVHRLNRATGEFVVTTPAGTVQVDKNTNSRVDVAANGATVVSVRWGRATVRANGDQPVTVVDAQRVYVDPGMLPSLPVAFDRAVEDAFDTWNRERCEILVNGISRVPSTVTVTPTTLGAAELASSGEWVYVENRHYWRPTVVVDYVPYRYGHWSYVPTYGHVWVGHYGFSYITSHYGRWNYFPTYGWCWSYDPIWAPAWVATARYGPYFVWTPIDFYNRPVFWGNASYFSLGGLRWNFYACSFAPVDYVYWGPSYIRPLYGSNIPTIYANNVTIWNIYGGSRYPDRHRIPYQDNRLTVRDYNPPRSIRGPEVYGPSGRAATDRVRVLEASAGRERFSTVDPAAPRSVRTASATGGRSANVRTINQIERPSRDAFLRGDVGRDGAPAAVRNARSDVDNEAARGRTRTDRSGAPGAPSASPPERTAPSVTRPDAVSPRTPGERTAPTPSRPDAVSPRRPGERTAPTPSRPDAVSPRTPGERKGPSIRTEPPAASSTGRTAPSGPSRSTGPTIRTTPTPSGPSVTRTVPGPSRSDSTSVRTAPTRSAPSPRTAAPTPSAPVTRSAPSSPAPSRTYTAPSAPVPSRTYTVPRSSAPSRSYTAPSAPAPSRSYTAPSVPAPSRSYTAPSAPAPSRSYTAPSSPAPSRSYTAPSAPAPSRTYTAPSSPAPSRGSSAPTRSAPGGRGR